MRFSNSKSFFRAGDYLTERQALAFVLEEALLLLLLVIEFYRMLSIKVLGNSVHFFTSPIESSDLLITLGLLLALLLGYLLITIRDNKVWHIHKNFSRIVFGTAKLKLENTSKQKAVFIFAEVIYAFALACSIFVYLDPDINLVPAPYNYIGFAALAVIGFVLFSHTKEFRVFIYGATPLQKKLGLHEGKHEVRRFTNKKTGSIRVAPARKFRK